MSLKFYNTLTKKIEDFSPINPLEVSIYSCGPTVYDFAHIGNLRSYVFADILHRTLEFAGYKVNHVVNITDVGHLTSDADSGEDKMMKGLKREGLPVTIEGMRQLAEKFENLFKDDLKALNIKLANTFPRASEHIHEQIELIKKLEQKGITYETSDGIYFDTSKDPHYGALGGLTDTGEARTRVNDTDEKKNNRDFALWKFNGELGWDSPWDTGFPGWHIECSAMSQKYLGETFDIHTGGIDHIPVHHNNEIAQSTCATGKPLAHFWMHNEFVTVESGKMAKSEGNFITLNTLKEHDIHPLAYRYWLLTAHYRSPITFSYEAVEAAQHALERLVYALSEYKKDGDGVIIVEWMDGFEKVLFDDLNTPQAIAYLHAIENSNQSNADKYRTIIEIDKVLGLNLEKLSEDIQDIPNEIKALAEKRSALREEKQWEASDKIRTDIETKGFHIKDSGNNHVIWRPLASLI
ncbi:MAG: cysteine--tRNA ligase [Candidatus Zambryskibacteria bacterium CG10_big_fil_rev_8_21_14_0_10_42_12]|uniref:Cysteine--tRNA ligase n=1 Tax=Candidatus Zambryskibacteria bacterium CG10_big_fil_rev_8_21_14_0_10_42_12 TaxID=1975115 RepID=A0A2H0QVX1_9BACT|nr:MAG: cysteine--tRNA ligase [Candidatus Zambryskibacteria bacterium CG10_big_fil_rev_8_21_14_0_10_42_12]